MMKDDAEISALQQTLLQSVEDRISVAFLLFNDTTGDMRWRLERRGDRLVCEMVEARSGDKLVHVVQYKSGLKIPYPLRLELYADTSGSGILWYLSEEDRGPRFEGLTDANAGRLAQEMSDSMLDLCASIGQTAASDPTLAVMYESGLMRPLRNASETSPSAPEKKRGSYGVIGAVMALAGAVALVTAAVAVVPRALESGEEQLRTFLSQIPGPYKPR